VTEERDSESRDSSSRSQSERAEELLEQWGQRVARFVSTAAARPREEAEDIWAEAQSIRLRLGRDWDTAIALLFETPRPPANIA